MFCTYQVGNFLVSNNKRNRGNQIQKKERLRYTTSLDVLRMLQFVTSTTVLIWTYVYVYVTYVCVCVCMHIMCNICVYICIYNKNRLNMLAHDIISVKPMTSNKK